jgi:basic amino acid/polyamine antiporter, APA family
MLNEPSGLKPVLCLRDLILLSIGAVVGAGIFSAVGSAAAGNSDRLGAGPALVVSFALLGVACALAALCYAEMASMTPKAGSAYSYTREAFGPLLGWIIGWDLVLEYAVGNVAVAISWGDYFKSLLAYCGLDLPAWLSTGYRTALLSPDPAVHGLLDTCPRLLGLPILLNLPALGIVGSITWLLLRGTRESSLLNTIIVALKLVVVAVFVASGLGKINPDNYQPFAPNGWVGIHQGAAIVFFAYIGFDAISTAAEETKDPQRTLPRAILWGLGICTVIYVVVGAVLTGMAPWDQLGVADPLAKACKLAGLPLSGAFVSAGALISNTAVLLVFQYGQPRIFYAMSRDGLLPAWAGQLNSRGVPSRMTWITGLLVGLWALLGDAGETYDLTNIGTLFAFLLVCLGVLWLRIRQPQRPRLFRTPLVWLVAPLGAAACAYIMAGLPRVAWERFGAWLAIGLAVYGLRVVWWKK